MASFRPSSLPIGCAGEPFSGNLAVAATTPAGILSTWTRYSWTLPVPGRRASKPLLWRQDVVEEETEIDAFHVGALTPTGAFYCLLVGVSTGLMLTRPSVSAARDLDRVTVVCLCVRLLACLCSPIH